MYPDRCSVTRAESLREATVLLRRSGESAHVLAGGQSLVPLMKQRLATPETLIDIGHIEAGEISTTGDTVTIPSLTTHAEIGNHDRLGAWFDMISDVVPQIGDPQVRNMGTIGGGLAEADPGNDWGPVVSALGGTITAISPDGTREIPVDGFFKEPFTTALEHDELIESISLPIPPESTGGAYVKAKRRVGGYGTASAGVQLTIDPDGVCRSIHCCCADDVSTYVIPQGVESTVEGETIDERVIDRCAELVALAVTPVSDTRGSAEYKRTLCGTLFQRAMRAAFLRASGQRVDDPMAVTGGIPT